VAAAPDGTFTVHCPTAEALVELVRDPRQTRFRIRAEVRHEASSDGGSRVGVYFARRLLPSAGGPVQHFGTMAYNDIRDEAKAYDDIIGKRKLPPGVAPPRRPTGNRFALAPHLYAHGPAGLWGPTFGGALGDFKPGGVGAGIWRPIEVVVTPDGVEGAWAGGNVVALPSSRWDKEVSEHLASRRAAPSPVPYLDGLNPAYAPGGGLGLYVLRGSASFRRVAVEPLDKPD
jgi:hypothetical protein